VDPVRNPYAPGAGQRPPELAGRDRELEVFDVVLERVARHRPERSLVLTGLRGVGKTVLLNTLRSQAINRLEGVVTDVGYLGGSTVYKVRLDSGAVVRSSVANTARLDIDTLSVGQRVVAWFTPDDCAVLER